jgi:lysophospholipase L1-like esterase
MALLVVACSPPPPPPPPSAVQGGGGFEYVAMGDSWAAGPLMSFPVGEPLFCARSSNNYPSQLAALLSVDRFADVTCGSADSEDVTRPQEVDPLDLGLDLGTAAPQADALGPDTDLVTITMGGNDIGLPKFAIACANLIGIPLGPAPFGRPCVQDLTAGGVDQVSEKIAATRPEIVEMLRTIRRRAPSAAVYVVGYPAGLAQGGTGCWGRWPILDVDAGYIDAKMQEMNAMLADAARIAGVRFVDVYTSSLGHDACQPRGQAWVNGISFDPDGIPLHPNSRSAANTAAVVAAAVQRHGVR